MSGDRDSPDAYPRLSILTIQGWVASGMGVTVASMRGRRRDRPAVVPRQVAMWLAHRDGFSTVQIGRSFGNRDHTTVMHGCRRIDARRRDDREFAALVDSLAREIDAAARRIARPLVPRVNMLAVPRPVVPLAAGLVGAPP